jgi:hypothetical protein
MLGFIDTLDLLIYVGSGRVGAPRVPSANICQAVEARRTLLRYAGVAVASNFDEA